MIERSTLDVAFHQAGCSDGARHKLCTILLSWSGDPDRTPFRSEHHQRVELKDEHLHEERRRQAPTGRGESN